MVTLKRTDPGDKDFIDLVRLLDAELAKRDGDDHAFYLQYNGIVSIRHIVIAYDEGKPAGCGAIKEFDKQTMEIKRMFVKPDHRRKGIASKVLNELEKWAGELSFTRCILETGMKQPEAIELYKRTGYTIIPNYGQYAGIETSVCFLKSI
jgi:putative acetyltransferase